MQGKLLRLISSAACLPRVGRFSDAPEWSSAAYGVLTDTELSRMVTELTYRGFHLFYALRFVLTG